MDRLRSDVRALFDSRQSALSDMPASRDRILRAGLASRTESTERRGQLMAGVAAAVIALLLITTFVYVRLNGRSVIVPNVKPSAMPTVPVKGSPAPGFRVAIEGGDSVDAAHGWALLTNCVQPMTGKCQYGVTFTNDGGRDWSKPVRVGGDFNPGDGGAPRHVYFIDPDDGFVYGGTAAFVTHDGGKTWRSLEVHASFFDIIGGTGTRAWLTTWPCAKGDASCSYQLLISVDGGRTWSEVRAFPRGFYPYRVAGFGQAGLVATDEAPGDLQLSLDDGATWVGSQSRCGNGLESVVATDGANELWQLCIDYPEPGATVAKRMLWVSEDGGTTWVRRSISSVTAAQAAGGFFQVVASPSVGTAIVASNQTSMAITHDGGSTWHDVGPRDVGFVSVRFVDASFGVAVDTSGGIWVSKDGGDHWTGWAVEVRSPLGS